MKYFTIVDYVYGPIAFILIVIFARVRKYRMIATHPEYKYYTKGLYVKIVGGISLCLIYALYYGGGDTVNYYNDSVCMMKLIVYNPSAFLHIMSEGLSMQSFYYFNDDTGYPIYWRDDKATFYVVRLATPIVTLGASSFIVSTLIFALISYNGMWKLYNVFISEFPDLKKEMAYAILFIPSVFFWGSGIMKDTVTMTCVGYYTYSFYQVMIRGNRKYGNIITMLISTYLILMIKPYIVFALLPGSIIWYVNKHTGDMKNVVIKTLLGPFFLIIATIGGYFLLINMGGVLGTYAVDQVLEKAVVTNQDLKADYYGGNSFDIGDFEPTVPSMLAKAPAAINAAIFRPYLWESNNIVMVMSGIECFIFLLLTIRVIIKTRIIGIFTMMSKHHLLTFSLIFSLFFAFSVGISTSNFGSLVRYRIPVLPFFIASLFIIEHLYNVKVRKIHVERIFEKNPTDDK
jgi:hypothetical protein